MRLSSKLLSFFIPSLVIALALLGTTSFKLAKEALLQQELALLNVLTERIVLNTFDSRRKLLVDSGLSGIAAFEQSYQQEAFSELSALANDTDKVLHVISRDTKELVFSTEQGDLCERLLSIELADSGVQRSGQYLSRGEDKLYSGFHFPYWRWDIFITESVDKVSAPIASIQLVTISAIIGIALLMTAIFWLITRVIIVAPVRRLKEMTQEISDTKAHVQSNMTAHDELSDLGHEISVMSVSIESSIAQAQAASQAKTAFLATMSHEIRTPLNGLIGMTRILSKTQLTSAQREMTDALLLSSQTLGSVINDVLDLSKIEAGKIDVERIDFDPHELLMGVQAVFTNTAQDNNNRLQCECNVPNNLVLKTDLTRVRQIIFNLLGNAVKFTHNGEINLLLSLEANLDSKRATQTMKIQCQDTGIGIESSRVSAIFDAFTQSDDTTTRNYGGSGLGLAIVKQLTEILGGHIDVTSEVGRGSEFVVCIPVEVAEKCDTELKAEAPQSMQAFRGKKILLVEDNEINQIVAKSILEQLDIHVFTAVNGEEAVKAASRAKFDVILMDIHMPILDGVEATKQIRAFDSEAAKVPIIGLTAEAFSERHSDFINAGMNDVLTKPIDENILQQKIRQFIN